MSDFKLASERIDTLCRRSGTALQAIHVLHQTGGASQAAFRVLYERVMADQDVQAAYYLAVFALEIDDLPYDGKPLVELVMTHGDTALKQKLLAKIPAQQT